MALLRSVATFLLFTFVAPTATAEELPETDTLDSGEEDWSSAHVRPGGGAYFGGTALGIAGWALPAVVSLQLWTADNDHCDERHGCYYSELLLIGAAVFVAPYVITGGAAISTLGLHRMGVSTNRWPLLVAVSGFTIGPWGIFLEESLSIGNDDQALIAGLAIAALGSTTQLVWNIVQVRRAMSRGLRLSMAPSVLPGRAPGFVLGTAW